MDEVLQRLNAIEERNTRVDADKAWETSVVRRAAIVLLTYATVLVYGFAIDAQNPWLNAAIPCLGFVLSTIVIGPIKQRYLRRLAA